ncbi:hypothetical protein [Helicobacter pylori]|uniref:hypothetical protein n=1 Tax=Helicobacter pylori TaxID=210 RepID=UPI000EB3489D|nr:hypothetical protein [Helicobacter pylori]
MAKMNSYRKLKAENTMLKAENQEFKGKIERLEKEVSRLNDNVKKICDLLLKMDTQDTQKFIYYKGDDNNSVGKLVGIGSKREGYTSTLYPYVVE